MNRRTFVSMVAAGAASTLIRDANAAAPPAPIARNVVLVHGLFADGSSWSEVIARLQAAGLNVTAVQNPLTTLPEAKAKVLYAVQEPFQRALLVGKTTHAAWRAKPSFYAVSTGDRTIDPDLQRFMAKRMAAKTIEVKAGHLALISRPDTITNLILEAAGQSKRKALL